jgi:hypothetical protein
VSHSKDDIKALKESVQEKVAVGLKRIAFGRQFIVASNQDGRLLLSFDEAKSQEGETICDVPRQPFINGDLKYSAQLLGCEGVSSSWCMWCQSHPSEWKHNLRAENLWTINLQKDFYYKKERGELKEPKKILSSHPTTSFLCCTFKLVQCTTCWITFEPLLKRS